jgi:hypothetical protein
MTHRVRHCGQRLVRSIHSVMHSVQNWWPQMVMVISSMVSRQMQQVPSWGPSCGSAPAGLAPCSTSADAPPAGWQVRASTRPLGNSIWCKQASPKQAVIHTHKRVEVGQLLEFGDLVWPYLLPPAAPRLPLPASC